MCVNCKSVMLSVTTSCMSREFFLDQIYFLWSNSACFYTEMERKVSIYSWIFFYHLLLVIIDLLCHEKEVGLHAKIWTFGCAPTNAKTNFSVKPNFFMAMQCQIILNYSDCNDIWLCHTTWLLLFSVHRWFSVGICKYKRGYKSHDLL